MKRYFYNILVIVFTVVINLHSTITAGLIKMNQYSDRTEEIQKCFFPYIQKIPSNLRISDRLKGFKCDGIYNPQTFELVIATLQYVIGEKPDGFFGRGTEEKCQILTKTIPTIFSIILKNPSLINIEETQQTCLSKEKAQQNNFLTKDGQNIFIKIAQAGLYFNNISAPFDGQFSEKTTIAVKEFQKFMCLEETGFVDGITMKALLSSGGSKIRPATGCDCATQLTKESALALYGAGYRFIARYLTSKQGPLGKYLQKHLTIEEIDVIHDAGLSLVLFFQEGMHDKEHCSSEQGTIDGEKAVVAANKLNIPKNSTIYGVVDADVEPECLVDYFSNMSKLVRSDGYEFGVYGSRAVCSLMAEKGISKYSYVAGMSYRYKGNLGHPMPSNWAFNQEYPLIDRKDKGDERFKSPNQIIDLDRVVVSGRDLGIIRSDH